MKFSNRILGALQLAFAAWIVVGSANAQFIQQFIQQGPKLVGTGAGSTYVQQGFSVAISADGNTALVSGDSDNNATGAVWVWTRTDGVWTQQGPKLVGTGAVANEEQGASVALSADGNTALVGGTGDNNGAGAAWVWTHSGGVWTQQGPKLIGTGAVGTAFQGSSVALSADGNTALIGGYGDNGFAGAVWVWTRSGGVWTQQGPKLIGSGAVANARQGSSLALSADGNTAVIGGAGAGGVWVWTRSGSVWAQQGTELIGTGAVGNAIQGWSVALSADGNTALVGGYGDNSLAGAVWVWTRAGGAWTQQGLKLVGTGAVGQAVQGWSVALSADGNTAFVGGTTENSGAGAVWMWTRSGGVWTQQGLKLVGTGAVGNAGQGWSVSLSADGRTALVGGIYDSAGMGAVWVFVNRILDPTFFVTQLYIDILNRQPDPGGLAFWLGFLNSGNMSRAQVAAAFFQSPEFLNGGLEIIKYYIAVLRRDPDFAGWQFWFAQWQNGESLAAILTSFVSGPEFQNTYGALSNAAFVNLVYQNVLGRAAEPAGFNFWVNLLNTGQITRTAMMASFIDGPEFSNNVQARAYANLLYMGFLRRTPDPAGLQFWTTQLANPSNLASAIDTFITGSEYLARF